MLTTDQAQHLLGNGGNVVDNEGNKIGSIGQVFLDDQSGNPEWITAKTGIFGGAESFVPLREAEVSGDDVRVPFDKNTVEDAPRIDDPEGHLSEDEEATLYSYFGGSDSVPSQTSSEDRDRGDSTVGHDASGPTTDSAMTRSEEQVTVGTETHTTGKMRLRKYVVTENVTQTVPVSHEEVRLEREPITDANRGDATSGGDLTTEEHDVVLHEERVVVDKETVPVERVRMEKETVTGEEQVDETVRKEQIELDDQSETAPNHSDRDGDRG